MLGNKRYEAILESLIAQRRDNIEDLASGRKRLILPKIPKSEVIGICSEVGSLMMSAPTVISIDPPQIVVGDIHGHFLDLLRVLKTFGMPGTVRYLFMGDLIDRGEFSLETVITVFLLIILHPDRVHMVRGNHEFREMCESNGFMEDVMTAYADNAVFEAFMYAFSYLPLAAQIKTIFCVHGGIGPSTVSINQISKIRRPITTCDNTRAMDILWSDPDNTDTVEYFAESSRGLGSVFGNLALQEFLDCNHLTLLVRAHECVSEGTRYRLGGKSLTIFGASNYCGVTNNKSGVLHIQEDGTLRTQQFEPLNYLLRSFAYHDAIQGVKKRRLSDTSTSNIQKPHQLGPVDHTHVKTARSPTRRSVPNLALAVRKNPSSARTKKT